MTVSMKKRDWASQKVTVGDGRGFPQILNTVGGWLAELEDEVVALPDELTAHISNELTQAKAVLDQLVAAAEHSESTTAEQLAQVQLLATQVQTWTGQAQAAVAGDVIDDGSVGALTTWSSLELARVLYTPRGELEVQRPEYALTGATASISVGGLETLTGDAVGYLLSDTQGVAIQSQSEDTVDILFGAPGAASMSVTPVCKGATAPPFSVEFDVLAQHEVPLTLMTPAAGAMDIALQPVLTLQTSDTADQVEVVVSIKQDFSALHWSYSGVALDAVTVASVLPVSTEVYWRARQHSSGGWSRWTTASFNTATMALGAVLETGEIVAAVLEGDYIIIKPSAEWLLRKVGLYGVDTPLQNFTYEQLDTQSGALNTDVLTGYLSYKDQFNTTGAPAAEYCRSFGPDWFLGSNKEVHAIFENREIIRAADTNPGSLMFDSSVPNIITSTEIDSHSFASIRQDGSMGYEQATTWPFVAIPMRRVAI